MVLASFLLAASVMFVHLYSHEKTNEIYQEETEKVILMLKKDFLSDTVNNLIMEIDSLRAQKKEVYQLNTDARQRRFVEEYYVSEEEFVYFYENRFRSDANQDLWTAVLYDKETEDILFATKNLEGKTLSEIKRFLEESLLSRGEVEVGNLQGILGVTKEYVEDQVKLEVAESIRTRRFSNDSYIWVNEVLNYEGGEGYAVRRVHPNLPETEGSLLSTETEDMKGNKPYEIELRGINEKGEHYFNYFFKKLNSEEISEKITYAKLYKDFDWIIAMGVHVDEINAYTDTVREDIGGLTSEIAFRILAYLLLILLVGLFFLQVMGKVRMKESQKYLEKEVNVDLLTGAETRRRGVRNLQAHFDRYEVSKESIGILMLDIDKFKYINDTFGHHVGDEVLKKTTAAIQHMIRSSDHLIRWGGDEFIGILPGMKEEYLHEFGEKLLQEVAKLGIFSQGVPVKVTLSMGLTVFRKEDRSYEDALKRADLALYESKNRGRDQVTVL